MVELLSPAGDLDSMYAAFAAGADAVYAGANEFSARAYSANFDAGGMTAAIDYAHLIGKKLYLTLNTLIKEDELKRIADFVSPFYKAGLDGCIVQDMGVVAILREKFPGMEIHGSTQLSIANKYGAEYCKSKGMTRVVTARELSLDEIKNIRDNVDIEIEAFIHGAMCYSYSGLCLFSSFLGGRSGNRGRCAGPCRQPYTAGGRKDKYLLSMKDMCTLDILPEIIGAGVGSLKIEGRMKAPEYVYAVTKIYRKYLDLYYKESGEYYVNREELNDLVNLYSRGGLSHGYYERHNGSEMITYEKGAYRTEFNEIKIPKAPVVSLKGHCDLSVGKPVRLTVRAGEKEISVDGDTVQRAVSRPLSKDEIAGRLNKTGDTHFKFDELSVEADGDVFLPVGAINALRRRALEYINEELLSEYRRAV